MFLSSNFLESPDPTVFELALAENLTNGIKPAFEFVLGVLSERYPFLFSAYAWKDELLLTSVLFLERYYLNWFNGSFSENFYGVKRERLIRRLDGYNFVRPMNRNEKMLSLFWLACVPYIRTKVLKLRSIIAKRVLDEENRRRSRDRLSNPKLRKSELSRKCSDENESHGFYPKPLLEKVLTRFFIICTPYFLASFDAWSLVFKILFAFKKTRFYSPALYWQGIILSRVTGDDVRKQMEQEKLVASTRGYMRRVFSSAVNFLQYGLLAAALGFRVVEWYYSPENRSQREQTEGPHLVPPPPLPPRPLVGGLGLPSDSRLCSICLKSRANPAVCSSGIVYCFKCIHRFVTENGCCPVSGIPSSTKQIRRIFTE